jgi:hypothetical protein
MQIYTNETTYDTKATRLLPTKGCVTIVLLGWDDVHSLWEIPNSNSYLIDRASLHWCHKPTWRHSHEYEPPLTCFWAEAHRWWCHELFRSLLEGTTWKQSPESLTSSSRFPRGEGVWQWGPLVGVVFYPYATPFSIVPSMSTLWSCTYFSPSNGDRYYVAVSLCFISRLDSTSIDTGVSYLTLKCVMACK